MGISDRTRIGTPATACMVVFFLSVSMVCDGAVPGADDINNLADRARLASDTFMQESFNLRMGYEYNGGFPDSANREKLHSLANNASEKLSKTAHEQNKLKQIIEDYQGQDWDERYGATGLWRKLSADVYVANLSKCEIDYYLGLSSQQLQQDEILREIPRRIDSLTQDFDMPYAHLIKARALATLARTDSKWKAAAKKDFNLLKTQSDIRPSISFRAEIERIRLFGIDKGGRSIALIEQIAQSSCADDLELVLVLASLQRELNKPEAIEKTVSTLPRTGDLLGSFILTEINRKVRTGESIDQALEGFSVFEVELAAEAAWKDTAAEHRALLEYLSDMKRFQTPLIMYAAASASAESAPIRAVGLLMRASNLQRRRKSNRLSIPAGEIAAQAARLAYELSTDRSIDCVLGMEAFANYEAIADARLDDELEYLHAVVLNDCGENERGRKLLQAIANRPTGKKRSRARLDLIMQTIRQANPGKDQYKTAATNLRNLIAACDRQNEPDQAVRTEATALYCRLVFESQDEDAPRKVLNILTDAVPERGPDLVMLKSKALRSLGRLDEAADWLSEAVANKQCEYDEEVMELLSRIVEEMDHFGEGRTDLMEKCRQLAAVSYDCLEGGWKRRTGLFLLEISLFSSGNKENRLFELEKLADDLSATDADTDADILRCRARLLAAQGKFADAARLWARTAEIRRSELVGVDRQSREWWRAKYYELYCWSKMRTDKKAVAHAVEVLENSYGDIPQLWAARLSSLKNMRTNRSRQPTNTLIH